MNHTEPDTWLSIPRWLWRLVVPAGALVAVWVATLVIPALTVLVLAVLSSIVFLASAEGEPMEPSPLPIIAAPAPAPTPTLGTMTHRCPLSSLNGAVWGTDVYTSDSSVCMAALHAGVIDKGGGNVVAQMTTGCKSYAGSSRNGVQTSNWGQYQTSFYFPQHSDGRCSEASSPPLRLLD